MSNCNIENEIFSEIALSRETEKITDKIRATKPTQRGSSFLMPESTSPSRERNNSVNELAHELASRGGFGPGIFGVRDIKRSSIVQAILTSVLSKEVNGVLPRNGSNVRVLFQKCWDRNQFPELQKQVEDEITYVMRELVAFQEMIGANSANPLVEEFDQIIETFEGIVTRVEAGIASLTLFDSKGRKSFAECNVSELKEQGIQDGSKFVCEIKKRDKETVMSMKAVKEDPLPPGFWKERIDKARKIVGD